MKVNEPTRLFFFKECTHDPWFTDKAPLSQLNPKKKIFETIQPGLSSCLCPDHVHF